LESRKLNIISGEYQNPAKQVSNLENKFKLKEHSLNELKVKTRPNLFGKQSTEPKIYRGVLGGEDVCSQKVREATVS
jgi:hypothetical protein